VVEMSNDEDLVDNNKEEDENSMMVEEVQIRG